MSEGKAGLRPSCGQLVTLPSLRHAPGVPEWVRDEWAVNRRLFPYDLRSGSAVQGWANMRQSDELPTIRARTRNTLLSMVRKKTTLALSLLAAIMFHMTALLSSAFAETPDKPLRTTVVDLGLSPDQAHKDNLHIKLSCYYYPNFMVKQLDDAGSQGALWFALVPSRLGHVPACVQTHGSEEIVFAQDWCGYFGGVKRDLVLLNACDGFGGGFGFGVFDSVTGTKVFEDLVSIKKNRGGIDFVPSSGEQMILRYRRVVIGDCSVPKDGGVCWNKFRKQPGLKAAPMPKCSDYEGTDAGVSSSVIAYPVEVLLFPKPAIKALANPVECWPAD